MPRDRPVLLIAPLEVVEVEEEEEDQVVNMFHPRDAEMPVEAGSTTPVVVVVVDLAGLETVEEVATPVVDGTKVDDKMTAVAVVVDQARTGIVVVTVVAMVTVIVVVDTEIVVETAVAAVAGNEVVPVYHLARSIPTYYINMR